MLNFVAKAAIQIGLMGANMALTMSRKIEGPRLDDLKFTSGDYGNPLAMVWGKRRIQCPIFWAEDLKEVKRQRKTKGGKYNEYTYYGTWAVALAGHQIDKVLRVWFDTHLAYDVTGAGPVTPFDVADGVTAENFMTVYLGTETQDPDPRIQATTEAKHGEGSCPAYRGTAYIVFKDLPLEKLGNRIPQVSVEFTTGTTAIFPCEVYAVNHQPVNLLGATFSTDYSRFLWSAGANYEIWDVAARTRMVAGAWPHATALTSRYGMYANGNILAVASSLDKLYQFSPDGMFSTDVVTFGDVTHYQQEVRVVADGSGAEHWLTIPYSTISHFWMDGAEYSMSALTGIAWTPYEYFADENGAIWAVGRPTGTGATTAYFYRVSGAGDGPGFITVTGLPSIGIALGNVTGCWSDGALVLCWMPVATTDCLYRIDPATGTVTDSRTDLSLITTHAVAQFANLPPNSTSIWLDESEISLATLATIRTIDSSLWIAGGIDAVIYDPINNALWGDQGLLDQIDILFLDRVGSNGIRLSTIAADLATMVDASGTDFSNLDQLIPGWSATQGQASAILEPLLDAYDSDIRPHGFTLQGLKRTGTSGGTLLTERFKADNPRYSVKVRQAAELPRAITVNFADTGADQQPNNARADRPLDSTGARGEKSIDLSTLAIDKDAARDLADRYFRRIWNERTEVSLGLTAQQLTLEPGDVQTLNLDGEQMAARLVKLTIKADDSLATEWVYDHPSLAVVAGGTGASFDGRDPSVIVVPLISRGFVFDIPLLMDVNASANPLLYIAAGPYASGTWPGATIYRSLSGEYTDEMGSIPATSPVTWGYVATALPYSNPNLWDRVSSIKVTLQTGSISGTTEAEIDANPTRNMAAIGAEGRWEIVNFTTATLTAPNTYTVSGFKRGRRGTEWAAELHQTSDQFVLLDTVATAALGLSDVGVNQSFKAVTNGRTTSGAFPIPIEPFTGASLKPYAPCHLAGVKDSGTGDWALSWVRRTRVGGAWTSGTSIPLSEASEAYEVEILNGSTVVRTITGLTSPAATWTAAQQTTDFGSGQSSVHFNVYQISDAVGRGFVASATV